MRLNLRLVDGKYTGVDRVSGCVWGAEADALTCEEDKTVWHYGILWKRQCRKAPRLERSLTVMKVANKTMLHTTLAIAGYGRSRLPYLVIRPVLIL